MASVLAHSSQGMLQDCAGASFWKEGFGNFLEEVHWDSPHGHSSIWTTKNCLEDKFTLVLSSLCHISVSTWLGVGCRGSRIMPTIWRLPGSQADGLSSVYTSFFNFSLRGGLYLMIIPYLGTPAVLWTGSDLSVVRSRRL